MRRRDLLKASALLAGGCMAGRQEEAPAIPEPGAPRKNGRKAMNVLVIMTDDQRFDSFGFMGHPFLKTPFLDGIASQGAVCNNAFVTTSLCCPSRATMLTGRYAHDHGVINNTSELNASWPTFATLAQAAGVQTAYIGKWHMGGHTPERRPGWSTWMSFRGQGRYTYPGGKRVARLDRGMDVNDVFEPLDGYVTDLLTERAVTWLEQVDTSESPFLCVVSHKACHAPFTPAPRHANAFADVEVPEPLPNTQAAYEGLPEWLRRQRETLFGADKPYNRWPDFRSWYLDYHRTLLAVDEGVGALLDVLASRGLRENTAVLFLSDNGFMHGEKGTLDKRVGYDHSIRIPWLISLPEAPAGQRIDELVLNLDVAPTILDLLGLEPAESMRGRSIVPLVLGEPRDPWRQAFLYEYFFEPSFPATPGMYAVRTASSKLITYTGIPAADEVYDLAEDPQETKNLVDSRPELRRELQVSLRRAMDAAAVLDVPAYGEGQRDPMRAAVQNPRGRPAQPYRGLSQQEGDHEDADRGAAGDGEAGQEAEAE